MIVHESSDPLHTSAQLYDLRLKCSPTQGGKTFSKKPNHIFKIQDCFGLLSNLTTN